MVSYTLVSLVALVALVGGAPAVAYQCASAQYGEILYLFIFTLNCIYTSLHHTRGDIYLKVAAMLVSSGKPEKCAVQEISIHTYLIIQHFSIVFLLLALG